MAAAKRPGGGAPKTESCESVSTVIGPAFSMPEGAAMAAMADEAPPDFQAKQDAISETRRGPGKELAPKLESTRSKPSQAKESILKL